MAFYWTIDFHIASGETPLIHAARQGHTSTAKYLIEHGANPALSSELGATALHHVAGIGELFFSSYYLIYFIEKLLAWIYATWCL